MNPSPICRDYGDRPGCLCDADERYTMRFDDLGEPPIYWCAHCGPEAHAMNDTLTKAFEDGRTDEVAAAIEAAERENKERAH